MEGRTADLVSFRHATMNEQVDRLSCSFGMKPALKQEAMSADEWLNNLMFTPPSITASQAVALLPPQDIAYPAYQAYDLTAQ